MYFLCWPTPLCAVLYLAVFYYTHVAIPILKLSIIKNTVLNMRSSYYFETAVSLFMLLLLLSPLFLLPSIGSICSIVGMVIALYEQYQESHNMVIAGCYRLSMNYGMVRTGCYWLSMKPQKTELRVSSERDTARECMRSSWKNRNRNRNGGRRGIERDTEMDCMRSSSKGYVRIAWLPKHWLAIMYAFILLSTAQGIVP